MWSSHTYSIIHIKQHTGTKTPICKEGWMEYSFDRVFEYDRNSVLFYFHPERNEYTFKTPLSLSVQVTRKARIEKAHEQERVRKHQRCLERIRRDPKTSAASVRRVRVWSLRIFALTHSFLSKTGTHRHENCRIETTCQSSKNPIKD